MESIFCSSVCGKNTVFSVTGGGTVFTYGFPGDWDPHVIYYVSIHGNI